VTPEALTASSRQDACAPLLLERYHLTVRDGGVLLHVSLQRDSQLAMNTAPATLRATSPAQQRQARRHRASLLLPALRVGGGSGL